MSELKNKDQKITTNQTAYVAFTSDERIMNFEFPYGWTKEDRALLERLQDFIPDKIFDAHAHLHNTKYMPKGNTLFQSFGTADMTRLLADQKELYGDRKFRGLILPTPSLLFNDTPKMRLEMNAWMNEELYKAPDCVGAIHIVPDDTVEDIEAMLTNPQMRGFKCYHQNAKTSGPTWFSEVGEYLPESAWQVANERSMSITIHMVRPNALSDEKNLTYFSEMTKKYPNAKLILAHCARGFASWTTIEAIREMKGIPNLYYDMAAICDASTMFEVIRQAGPDHVMWGTDYCIDRCHATHLNTGETFRWLYQHELPEGVNFPICKMVLESLFSFKKASLMLDLTRSEIEQIFYRTGCQLFGLEE